jgi:hypothetical protein
MENMAHLQQGVQRNIDIIQEGLVVLDVTPHVEK